MLEVLDGIIATVAVVLVLSFIVQAIQQIAKQIFKLKSDYMEQQLLALFRVPAKEETTRTRAPVKEEKATTNNDDDDKSEEKLSERFSAGVKSGFKKAMSGVGEAVETITEDFQPTIFLRRKAGRQARDMVQELSKKTAPFGYKNFEFLEDIETAKFLEMVTSIGAFKKLDDETRASMEDQIKAWFDLTRMGFQRRYERKMKLWSFALSVVVVMILNADVITIYKDFAENKARRDAIVNSVPGLLALTERESGEGVGKGKQREAKVASADTLLTARINRYMVLIDSLVVDKSLNLLRWNTADGDSLRYNEATNGNLVRATGDFFVALWKHKFGWLGMILLVSLGSPFWYDFLKTIVGLKQTLRAKGAEAGTAKPS